MRHRRLLCIYMCVQRDWPGEDLKGLSPNGRWCLLCAVAEDRLLREVHGLILLTSVQMPADFWGGFFVCFFRSGYVVTLSV